ncbi:hypothetical protein BD779DRAFT_1670285 [Infundibulicybe gibba]|nr:hypothetical protein BD779DRAFT_1670285 [Infundibulicybe gibba]
MSASITRPLFGGAITATTPTHLIDASDLRQVPDTQEVFMYPDSGVSIIVEILERVEPSHFNDAIRFHFQSLAHDNSAQSPEVHKVDVIPNDRGDDTPSPILLHGLQYIQKFNSSLIDEVRIFMALFRVERKAIDVVVTFNVPTVSQDGGAISQDSVSTIEAQFNDLVRSLRIVDHGLFV